MFPLSSQKKHWSFNDENDLAVLREETNAEFISKHGANMTVSFYCFFGNYTFQLYVSSVAYALTTTAFYYYHLFGLFAHPCSL
jgi:hypothetical protein